MEWRPEMHQQNVQPRPTGTRENNLLARTVSSRLAEARGVGSGIGHGLLTVPSESVPSEAVCHRCVTALIDCS